MVGSASHASRVVFHGPDNYDSPGVAKHEHATRLNGEPPFYPILTDDPVLQTSIARPKEALMHPIKPVSYYIMSCVAVSLLGAPASGRGDNFS